MIIKFDDQDIMKALSIYAILHGYETSGGYDFRWGHNLTVTAEVKSLNGKEVSYDYLKKYAKS